MRCATCPQSALVEIRMRIAGADIVFRRCGGCETQGWATHEGPLELTHVLELARSD